MLQRCHPMAYDVRCPVFTMPSVSKWASWWKPQVASLVLNTNRRTETLMMPWNDNIDPRFTNVQGIFLQHFLDEFLKGHSSKITSPQFTKPFFFSHIGISPFCCLRWDGGCQWNFRSHLGHLTRLLYGNLLYIFFLLIEWRMSHCLVFKNYCRKSAEVEASNDSWNVHLLLLRSIINIVISVIIMIMGRVLWLWCLVLWLVMIHWLFSGFLPSMQFLNVFDPLVPAWWTKPHPECEEKNLETSSPWDEDMRWNPYCLTWISMYIYILYYVYVYPPFFEMASWGILHQQISPWLSLWWKPTILTWHHPRLDLRPVMWRIRHKHRNLWISAM